MREVLAHLGLVEAGGDVAPALAAFESNSQKGSAMSGPKAKVVQDADLAVIYRCVAAGLARVAASAGVVVQGGGANVLLPDSVGV